MSKKGICPMCGSDDCTLSINDFLKGKIYKPLEVERVDERPHCPECGYIYDGVKCNVCKYQFIK